MAIRRRHARHWCSLPHAMFAIHDRFTHHKNTITFGRDDGFTFHVDFSLNYAWFGRESAPEQERFWTENITIGKVDELLGLFICNQDAELRRFRWLGRPVKRNRR